MLKRHVKKDPLGPCSPGPWSSSIPCEIVCMTHDTDIQVLFKNQTDWAIDKLSYKNLFEPLILDFVQFFTLKDLVGMYKIK